MQDELIEIQKEIRIHQNDDKVVILEKGDKIQVLNEKGFELYVDKFVDVIRSMNDEPVELGANIAFATKKALYKIAEHLPFFDKKEIPIIIDSIIRKLK